jgi:hypothetical protein
MASARATAIHARFRIPRACLQAVAGIVVRDSHSHAIHSHAIHSHIRNLESFRGLEN